MKLTKKNKQLLIWFLVLIPTAVILAFDIGFINYLWKEWGTVSDPSPIGWGHVFCTIGFTVLPWMAGEIFGEQIRYNKDKNETDNDTA